MTEISLKCTDSGYDQILTTLSQIPWDGSMEVVFRKHKTRGTRSGPQNSALHLYITMLAAEMASGGLDLRTAIHVPISPTPENVKELIIRPVLKAMFPEKKSTTQLNKVELSALYEQINQMTSERWGIGIPFPHREGL